MKLKQWMQVIVVASSVITLAACSSAHKKNNTWAVNDTNSAYNGDDAQASGLGEESGFGDQDNTTRGKKQLSAAGRVYYFDFDSDVVRASDKASIDANAQRLASNSSTKVMLEGHTDPRGSREYNIGLGERRAKSVAEVMTNNGSKPKQIRVVSYGAEKLAATGHSDADYQKDRRVVLVDLQS